MKNEIKVKLLEYKKYYSEEKFFKKILNYAKAAGIKLVYAALLLFYTLQKPNLPAKIKGTIIGALGYFIFPLDLLSDLVPIVGYTDDITLLIAAIGITAFYIDDEVKKKAKSKLKDLFGDYDEDELIEVDEKIEQ